jgi:lysozyme
MTDIQGADWSHWQGLVDCSKAYAAGIRFVYIKVSQGVNYKDDRADANNAAARAAGIKTGFYHFLDTNAPGPQYDWMLKCIGNMPCDLPPVLDYEAVSNTIPLASTLYTMANKLKGWRGYPVPAIYTNPGTANSKLINSSTYNWSQFLLWIANWNVATPIIPTAWRGQPYYIWQDRVIKGAQAWGVDGDMDHDVWGAKLPFPGDVPAEHTYQYSGYWVEGKKYLCGELKERC